MPSYAQRLIFLFCLIMPTTSPAATETAYLAGGCFWGMQELLRKLPGVLQTEVGYSGGTTVNPNYEVVKTGRSGHAEAVRIEYDPTRLSYRHLLFEFFRLHNPTTPNQQGNDRGTQYRSVIFFASPAQERTAREVIDLVNASGEWQAPVVTQVLPFTAFYPAEAAHQDYLQKYPNGYTCHFRRPLKLGE